MGWDGRSKPEREDGDESIGAGTFVWSGQGRKLLFHRITQMHRVFNRRLISNGIQYLTQPAQKQ